MPPRPSLTAPSTGARATPDRAWKAAGTTGSTRSASMDSRGGTRQAQHFHVSDHRWRTNHAPDASHFGSLGLVYVTPFLRAGMDRVRQSRRPFHLPLPESAEDHGDELPVATRGRPAGALPGAGLVSAIARMARRERDRAALSVRLHQRSDLHQWSAGTSARRPDDSTRSGSD